MVKIGQNMVNVVFECPLRSLAKMHIYSKKICLDIGIRCMYSDDQFTLVSTYVDVAYQFIATNVRNKKTSFKVQKKFHLYN